MELKLEDNVSLIKYVGPSVSKILYAKNLKIVKDLWNYFPYKYEDTSNLLDVSQALKKLTASAFLNPDELPKLAIKAIVEDIQIITVKGKLTIIKAVLKDLKTNDKLLSVWFNQKYVLSNLEKDQIYAFYGKLKKRGITFELQAPIYEKLKKQMVHLGRITPVYSRIKTLSSKYIRRIIANIRSTVNLFHEFIPQKLLSEFNMLEISKAYELLHFPHNKNDITQAYYRLAVQELLELLDEKQNFTSALSAAYPVKYEKWLLDHSPFVLTQDQTAALKKILSLAQKPSKEVFLYGDVGAGKTLVFYLAALAFLKKGYNVILMAPTSVLANQHFNTLSNYPHPKDFRINIQLITSAQKKKKLQAKTPTIFIGTHALLYRQFSLNGEIGFLAIDEQHRFGTKQREQLKYSNPSGKIPFTLNMSATPIPRTLALTFYGYQEAVYIKQKPGHRKPVKTYLITKGKIKDMLSWIKQQVLEKDLQAYLVFPNIEGDFYEYGVKSWHELLSKSIFKNIPTGILHGKLKEKEKDEIMRLFKAGTIKILFSTTVIEVGIDVPNANIIAIFGAEHFGLAQLHQLRGRVGRSDEQAHCFVIGPKIRRLLFFTKQQDGLELAKFDLHNRGPGDLTAGIVQAGWEKLKIANLNNFFLIKQAGELFRKLKDSKISIIKYIN